MTSQQIDELAEAIKQRLRDMLKENYHNVMDNGVDENDDDVTG